MSNQSPLRTLSIEKALTQSLMLAIITPSELQAEFAVLAADCYATHCTKKQIEGAKKIASENASTLEALIDSQGSDLTDAFKEHMDRLLTTCVLELPVTSVPQLPAR